MRRWSQLKGLALVTLGPAMVIMSLTACGAAKPMPGPGGPSSVATSSLWHVVEGARPFDPLRFGNHVPNGGVVTEEAYAKAEQVRTAGLGLNQNLWFIPDATREYGIRVSFPAEAAAQVARGQCRTLFNGGAEGPSATLPAGVHEVVIPLLKGSAPSPTQGAPTVLASCSVVVLDPAKKAPFNGSAFAVVSK